MKLALRPYVTAGIVVAGAGLIVAAPIAPSALETQTLSVRLVDSAGDLTAGQDYPITDWEGAYSDTISNLQDLQSQISGNPDPIISAIENNMTTYANDLATGFQNSSDNLTTDLQDLGPLLTNALSDLQSGDLYDASTSLSNWLLETPLDVSRPVLNAEFEIIQSMVNNFDNLFSPGAIAYGDITSDVMSIFSIPAWFSDLASASLYGPNAAEYALSGVTQDIVDAWQAGDTTLALNDLLNAPSTIVDAFFNGYDVDDGFRSLVTDDAALRSGLDPSEGMLNGGLESVRRAEEIVAGDLGGDLRAQDTAAVSAGSTADLNAVVGDVTALFNADPALGDLVTAFDPNAVTDISSLLSLF